MKNIFIFTVMALTLSLTTGCKKDDGNNKPSVPQLQFSVNKVNIELTKTTTITFTGTLNPTDKVQIEKPEVLTQKGEIINNTLTFIAKKIGTTKVSIVTDKKQERGSFQVTVFSKPLFIDQIAHKADIPYYKTNITEVSEYKKLIEQTITEYNTLLATIEKHPQYPKDKYKYATQYSTWVEGTRISKGAIQNYGDKKSTIDLAEAKKTYEDLYQYGVVYANIELMARQAEGYRVKYPTNTEIENLIKTTFDGLYGTLEGNEHFIKSTNEEIVANFNKIIDIINKLNTHN